MVDATSHYECLATLVNERLCFLFANVIKQRTNWLSKLIKQIHSSEKLIICLAHFIKSIPRKKAPWIKLIINIYFKSQPLTGRIQLVQSITRTISEFESSILHCFSAPSLPFLVENWCLGAKFCLYLVPYILIKLLWEPRSHSWVKNPIIFDWHSV